MHVPAKLVASGLGLLLDVVLGAALLRLARVMLVLILGLLGTVARQPSHGPSDGARDAVRRARGVVVELAACLLLLALEILATTRLLKVLPKLLAKGGIRL